MLMDKTHQVMITRVVTVCKIRVRFDILVALDWNEFLNDLCLERDSVFPQRTAVTT